MKKAILIHGWGDKEEFYNPKYPTASNSHWFPWLSKQLMIRDIHTVALEMPNSFYPEYDIWKTELERFPIDEDTILIGHSCGGGFIVRYLSENNIKVGKVILVAPWLGIMKTDDTKWDDDPFDETFFKFDIDRNITEKTAGITLFESTNDVNMVQESIKILKDKVDDMKIVTLENRGHFTFEDLGTVEFPELLEEVIL
jgi:predicted alpha/beta hydrolase family esterase